MCLCIQVVMYYMRTLPLNEVNVACYKQIIPCMYVTCYMVHMCLLCLHITFGPLSIYVCIFCFCSAKGVRGKASEMTDRCRLFSRSIPLGLDLITKEEKLPPFLASRVNNKFPTQQAHSWCPTSQHVSSLYRNSLDLSPNLAPSKHHFTQAMSLPLAQSHHHHQYDHPMYQVPCQLSSSRYSVTTTAASLGIDAVIV